jgi:hypothetical protein
MIGLLFIPFMNSAQELNARIQVNYSQIQGSNKEIFEEMQKALYEFLNNRNWTNNVLKLKNALNVTFC